MYIGGADLRNCNCYPCYPRSFIYKGIPKFNSVSQSCQVSLSSPNLRQAAVCDQNTALGTPASLLLRHHTHACAYDDFGKPTILFENKIGHY